MKCTICGKEVDPMVSRETLFCSLDTLTLRLRMAVLYQAAGARKRRDAAEATVAPASLGKA